MTQSLEHYFSKDSPLKASNTLFSTAKVLCDAFDFCSVFKHTGLITAYVFVQFIDEFESFRHSRMKRLLTCGTGSVRDFT